jgi:quinol monooxygenase YgiN
VLITIVYEVEPDKQPEFVKAMQRVERMRRRTGAYRWGLFQDSDNPQRFVETYLARSWAEHIRQHTRATVTDRKIVDQARALQKSGTSPQVSHLIAAHLTAFDGTGGEKAHRGFRLVRKERTARK